MVLARRAAVVSLVGALLLVVGSIGPWLTIGPDSVSGLDKDGVVTLVLALLAAGPAAASLTASSVARVTRWFVLPWGLVALVVTIIDTVDIATDSAEFTHLEHDGVFELAVGWGLWLALVGAAVLCVGGVLLMVARIPRPTPPPPFPAGNVS